MPTRGVVYVHSTPLAVSTHVEWAIARVLAAPVSLQWTGQPADAGARRAECTWSGRPGTGAEIAAESAPETRRPLTEIRRTTTRLSLAAQPVSQQDRQLPQGSFPNAGPGEPDVAGVGCPTSGGVFVC